MGYEHRCEYCDVEVRHGERFCPAHEQPTSDHITVLNDGTTWTSLEDTIVILCENIEDVIDEDTNEIVIPKEPQIKYLDVSTLVEAWYAHKGGKTDEALCLLTKAEGNLIPY